MDITSKISVTFTPVDAETLFKKAVLEYLQTTYGIATDVKNVGVRFKATIAYDQMDRGPGSPEFSGVEVTINQSAPLPKSTRGIGEGH